MKNEQVPPQSERDFLGAIIDLAKTYGWRVAHFRPARTEKGWRTAVQADGVGFLDLVLVRKGSPIYFLECKSQKGMVSPEQARWLKLLDRAGSPAMVVRPSDWDALVELLR